MIEAATEVSARPAPSRREAAASAGCLGFTLREESAFLPVLTLILWTGCLAVGAAGLVFQYTRPVPPAKAPPPVTAEVLHVELTTEPLPPLSSEPPRLDLAQPPPLSPPVALPPAPPAMAVAAPSPQIAFAVPIDAPARVVPVQEASFRTLDMPVREVAPPAPPAPRPLTFGQGEGKQPAPEYPRQALREGQEGVVTVRFTVGNDGRVLAADAASPSPWPLLNDAAVRVVKNRWRFSPGTTRAYEVAIRFQLNR